MLFASLDHFSILLKLHNAQKKKKYEALEILLLVALKSVQKLE